MLHSRKNVSVVLRYSHFFPGLPESGKNRAGKYAGLDRFHAPISPQIAQLHVPKKNARIYPAKKRP